jgi:hypothetical protein
VVADGESGDGGETVADDRCLSGVNLRSRCARRGLRAEHDNRQRGNDREDEEEAVGLRCTTR